MSRLPFPSKAVFAGTAPEFFGSIKDSGTGAMLTASQCYKIVLNVACEVEFKGELVPVPHYVDVDVSVKEHLTELPQAGCCINFRHRCEVYDADGTPHSAFLEIGLRHRVEYAFYWRDAEGREKLPIKIVEIVSVI